MSLRDDLARILARDSRYSIQAYAFVFEALEHTKERKRTTRSRRRTPTKPTRLARHVTGQELCAGARDLALRQYGLLAWTVLSHWGIRSTSDLGEIVYNLIASGDLEATPTDSRTDFDNVFDLEAALRCDSVFDLDDVA